MSIVKSRRRKAKKSDRRISTSRILTMILAASVRNAASFAIFPLNSSSPPLHVFKKTQENRGFTRKRRQKLLSLKYANEDDNNTSDNDEGSSSSASHKPFVANPADSIRYDRDLNGVDEDPLVNQDSKAASRPTDISDAIKEVLTAPVIPSEEKEEDSIRMQRLILPINSHKAQDFPEASNTVIPNTKNHESKNTVATHKDRYSYGRFDLRRRWRRLRPGQKFRFRLGLGVIAFVSLWNTIVARNYGGFITSILTGAAATTTATGFGSLLRRWLSNRGFQGIAALGRSIAYGWAIFIAYPRMLDRRAKERRMKREEEVLKQWRTYLKAIADEVSRLKKELSLLDGEIRAFRREILAIRAARIESSEASSKNISHTDSSDNNNSNRSDINDRNNQSDRVLREAIINEMAHLTRLRDDTRLALTTARKRWSEVRSKRPISRSKSSAFDSLELELDIAADYGGLTIDNSDDDPLLAGF